MILFELDMHFWSLNDFLEFSIKQALLFLPTAIQARDTDGWGYRHVSCHQGDDQSKLLTHPGAHRRRGREQRRRRSGAPVDARSGEFNPEQRGKLDSGGAPAKWSPKLSPVSLTAAVTPAKLRIIASDDCNGK
jgi:hypothetical protein